MRVVIVGAGKVGEYLAKTLLKSDYEVVIIESDQKTAQRITDRLDSGGKLLVIKGYGCDSKFQEDAGIRQADIFVATTGQDDNNLVACEIAQRVFGVPRCVARVNNPSNMKIFQVLGIESISSTALIAGLIQEEALRGSMSAVSSLSQGQVALEEIAIPHMKHHSNTDGVRLASLRLPEGSLVVAVSDGDDTQVATPDTEIYPGDTVVVAADREVMAAVRNCFKSL